MSAEDAASACEAGEDVDDEETGMQNAYSMSDLIEGLDSDDSAHFVEASDELPSKKDIVSSDTPLVKSNGFTDPSTSCGGDITVAVTDSSPPDPPTLPCEESKESSGTAPNPEDRVCEVSQNGSKPVVSLAASSESVLEADLPAEPVITLSPIAESPSGEGFHVEDGDTTPNYEVQGHDAASHPTSHNEPPIYENVPLPAVNGDHSHQPWTANSEGRCEVISGSSGAFASVVGSVAAFSHSPLDSITISNHHEETSDARLYDDVASERANTLPLGENLSFKMSFSRQWKDPFVVEPVDMHVSAMAASSVSNVTTTTANPFFLTNTATNSVLSSTNSHSNTTFSGTTPMISNNTLTNNTSHVHVQAMFNVFNVSSSSVTSSTFVSTNPFHSLPTISELKLADTDRAMTTISVSEFDQFSSLASNAGNDDNNNVVKDLASRPEKTADLAFSKLFEELPRRTELPDKHSIPSGSDNTKSVPEAEKQVLDKWVDFSDQDVVLRRNARGRQTLPVRPRPKSMHSVKSLPLSPTKHPPPDAKYISVTFTDLEDSPCNRCKPTPGGKSKDTNVADDDVVLRRDVSKQSLRERPRPKSLFVKNISLEEVPRRLDLPGDLSKSTNDMSNTTENSPKSNSPLKQLDTMKSDPLRGSPSREATVAATVSNQHAVPLRRDTPCRQTLPVRPRPKSMIPIKSSQTIFDTEFEEIAQRSTPSSVGVKGYVTPQVMQVVEAPEHLKNWESFADKSSVVLRGEKKITSPVRPRPQSLAIQNISLNRTPQEVHVQTDDSVIMDSTPVTPLSNNQTSWERFTNDNVNLRRNTKARQTLPVRPRPKSMFASQSSSPRTIPTDQAPVSFDDNSFMNEIKDRQSKDNSNNIIKTTEDIKTGNNFAGLNGVIMRGSIGRDTMPVRSRPKSMHSVSYTPLMSRREISGTLSTPEDITSPSPKPQLQEVRLNNNAKTKTYHAELKTGTFEEQSGPANTHSVIADLCGKLRFKSEKNDLSVVSDVTLNEKQDKVSLSQIRSPDKLFSRGITHRQTTSNRTRPKSLYDTTRQLSFLQMDLDVLDYRSDKELNVPIDDIGSTYPGTKKNDMSMSRSQFYVDECSEGFSSDSTVSRSISMFNLSEIGRKSVVKKNKKISSANTRVVQQNIIEEDNKDISPSHLDTSSLVEPGNQMTSITAQVEKEVKRQPRVTFNLAPPDSQVCSSDEIKSPVTVVDDAHDHDDNSIIHQTSLVNSPIQKSHRNNVTSDKLPNNPVVQSSDDLIAFVEKAEREIPSAEQFLDSLLQETRRKKDVSSLDISTSRPAFESISPDAVSFSEFPSDTPFEPPPNQINSKHEPEADSGFDNLVRDRSLNTFKSESSLDTQQSDDVFEDAVSDWPGVTVDKAFPGEGNFMFFSLTFHDHVYPLSC